MQYIYLKLRRLILKLTIMLKLLYENLFTFIMKDQLIYMTELLISTKDALLLFKIQKAIQKDRGDTNICNRVIEIIVSKTESKNGDSNNDDQVISNEHKHKYKMISAENKD